MAGDTMRIAIAFWAYGLMGFWLGYMWKTLK
jgi:hypothetical protein